MEVYLDNSATTRPSPAVIRAVEAAMTEDWYNPSSLYKPSLETEKKVTAAREACLKAVHADGQRLIFTSCGTEADNLAILGYLRGVRKSGRVLMLCVEHPAVLDCKDEIRRLGHTPEDIPVRHDGTCDTERLEKMLDDDVHLICVMQVNNESGAIQPLAEVARLRDEKCPAAAIHVDGVQGFLRVPFNFSKSGIQSYAFSGHKIHALKGIGGLIVRKGHKLTAVMHGGGQEDGYRSGTENTPGILALGEAVRTYPAGIAEEMRTNKRFLYDKLLEAVPGAVVNGPAIDAPEAAPHILNMSFPPVRSQTMLFALEGDGIYVSAGSACASHKQRVSPVLTAMGVPNGLADCALRFSLCPGITKEQLAYTAECVKKQYDLLSRFTRR